MTRMKEIRKKRGYSQLDIQKMTGIDRSNYAKIEAGKRTMTVLQCWRLAVALETSMDYLTGRTDDLRPYPRTLE